MLPTGDSQPVPPALELGDLPADVLDSLLSLLPAAEVVRTSMLSQPWRRRRESVADLDINLDHRVRDWESAAGFLERSAAPVRSIRISGIPLSLFDHADGWLRTVAGKRPRWLSVALPEPTALPSVFCCDPAALASLNLDYCVLPAPPLAFAGFHRLTALDLHYVIFSRDQGWKQLEAMISAAGATLQTLRLANIAFLVADGGLPGRWSIQAPNLQRLELFLRMANAGSWELGHLPKLDYAKIMLDAEDPRDDYTMLFSALSSARELEIGNFDRAKTQVDRFTDMLALPWKFKHLRILKLHTHLNEVSTDLSIFWMLHHAPFIQILEITDNFRHESNNEEDPFAEIFFGRLHNCRLVYNLERLHMKNISCSKNDMQFIKHVLLYAKNLQLGMVEKCTEHRNSVLDASRMLINFERASPAARIYFKHGDLCLLV